LQVERQLAEFVQEQGSAVGALERTAMRGHSAGERAALVAQKFTFGQILRDRATVEDHERALLARAAFMNRARQHVLAGARFTGQGDGHLGACQRVEQLENVPHRGRDAGNLAGNSHGRKRRGRRAVRNRRGWWRAR